MNSNRNNVNNSIANQSYTAITKRYNKSSTVERVILGVVVVCCIYVIYRYFFVNSKETSVFSLVDASKKMLIPSSDIPAFTMTDYSISIWFYISDWNKAYGQEKYLVGKYMKDPSSDDYKPIPSLTLDPFTNNIKVSLAYANPSSSINAKTNIQVHDCVLNGVPLQKWTNVILSMNNRTLDIYLDGKLRRTCLLPGVPKGNPSSDMYVAGSPRPEDIGFSGFLSDLKVYTYAMTPREAYNLYRNGHSGSGLGSAMNKYKIKMSVVEDNQEVNSVTFP